MKADTQRSIARVIGAAAAIVTLACAALLVTWYVGGCLRRPIDEDRLAVLEEAAKEGLEQLPALVEEQDRQRDASLVKEDRTAFASYLLIGAGALFLIGVKWSVALAGRRMPRRMRIREERAGPARGLMAGVNREETRSLTVGALLAVPSAPCESCRTEETDLSIVDEAIARHGRGKEAVIPLLQAIQTHERYLPRPALRQVCAQTQITPAQIAGVSTFYTQFRHAPVGRHVIKVCHGTACHVAGAGVITNEIRRSLGIADGEDTDAAREFTIEPVACMGCCTLAPVAQVDEVTYGHLELDRVAGMLDDGRMSFAMGHGFDTGGTRATGPLSQRIEARAARAGAFQGEIRIGLGSCCVAGGSAKVHDALERAVAHLGANVTIRRVGCVGMCHQTPLVELVVPGRATALYAAVDPSGADAIVRRHFRANGVARRLTTRAADLLDRLRSERNGRRDVFRSIEVRDPPVAAFLGPQKHITTEHSSEVDPTDLDEYLLRDGFKALRRCVAGLEQPRSLCSEPRASARAKSPELEDVGQAENRCREAESALTSRDIIDEITKSGLRGRGGAGFPTGSKWSAVKRAEGATKYVICNGDEGDPGAFMDRMLMESVPYRIIEGLTIAALAVGAEQGYFYIRAEYPLAVERIKEALAQCEDRGFVGDNILGSGRKLHLKIMEGAGAFVCGEETALIASIQGDRGSPRLRPPYPARAGLWGKPTLVCNVETFATIPWILRHGADAHAELGTKTSKGTKVFALAGKVKRGGLIEVEMGVTIREIVEQIGGGIKGDHTFKAVQIGGPSGGCIPAALADTPVDYEALIEVGAIMGSGGLVVLDERDCVVDIARYFLSFTQDQSCGKCTYCRIGTRRMLDIMDRLCAGEGRSGDLESLEDLARAVGSGSLCGLGRTAPNPVLSTLRYFRDEYEAHLERRCPAGKCAALIAYRVTDACIGCTLCAQHCPVDAIAFTPYERHVIDDDLCTRCDTCRAKCPETAIEVV